MNAQQWMITIKIGLVMVVFGCRDKVKNPNPNAENELITTVELVCKDSTGSSFRGRWKDLTPSDEAGRVRDTLFLTAHQSYTGEIQFLDETKSPPDDLTEEVKKEANDHLVVYEVKSPLMPAQLSISRTDKDSRNLEVGLKTTIQTGGKGKGELRIILKHQPGEKDGTPNPGETDVDILIPVVIQ